MASTYDYEVGINEIEGDPEEEEEDEIEATEPPHHARRPMNAFLIFCKRQRAVVKERFPQLENRAVTKILGEWWANLEDCEKSCYTDLAKQYREAFLKANPGFKWYKLPAPPLRPISNRLKLLTSLSSHQGSITPGKLADESQLGGLSSLLVPYNNMSVSPSLAIQSIPKPPKKRYLEENATTDDDPNQVFDDMLEKTVTMENEMSQNGGESNAVWDKITEVEPFAKLRNYSVSVKENSAKVKIESDSDNMSAKNDGSFQPIPSAEIHLVSSGNNDICNNDLNSCNFSRNGFHAKNEEKFSSSEGSRMYINVDTLSNDTFPRNGLDCTEVKWRTKFEKIKSRHSNYNNNNNDDTLDFLKCSNYECSSNQVSTSKKQANEKLNEIAKDNGGVIVKAEDIFSNGDGKLTLHAAEEMDDCSLNLHGPVSQISPTSSSEFHHNVFNRASALTKKSDIVFYGSNKLPDLKTANKILSKSVPISSNESDSNFIRRNKSVRACKGVRYQEFMSSNQLGRKRRRKMNASNDSRYYSNEDDDALNRHLVKIGAEEDKSVKDEDKYERMEVESAIYSIHDDLDQNINTFNESSAFNISATKSLQPKKTKHMRANKRRRSSQKGANSFESTNDELDFDRKNNSTNFNLEEKIEALPALSLEEFQEKKRARNKKHYYLENSSGHEFVSDSHFSFSERHSNFQNLKNSSPILKSKMSESSSPSFGFDGSMHKNFISKASHSKDMNGFAVHLNGTIGESEVDRKLGLLVAVSVSNSSPAQSYSSSASSVNGTSQKSPMSPVASDVIVGSRKRKARKQKITHLEPGSKQKDTSVVEVDILNDMGLATLAEVAARSEKESII